MRNTCMLCLKKGSIRFKWKTKRWRVWSWEQHLIVILWFNSLWGKTVCTFCQTLVSSTTSVWRRSQSKSFHRYLSYKTLSQCIIWRALTSFILLQGSCCGWLISIQKSWKGSTATTLTFAVCTLMRTIWF